MAAATWRAAILKFVYPCLYFSALLPVSPLLLCLLTFWTILLFGMAIQNCLLIGLPLGSGTLPVSVFFWLSAALRHESYCMFDSSAWDYLRLNRTRLTKLCPKLNISKSLKMILNRHHDIVHHFMFPKYFIIKAPHHFQIKALTISNIFDVQ